MTLFPLKGPPARRARWLLALTIPAGVALNVVLALSSGALFLEPLPFRGLLLAVGLALTPWLFSAIRMMLWTGFVGQRLPFLSALRATLSGIVGSAVTPTGSGAGAIKWGLATRQGIPPGIAGSLLAIETLEEAVVVAVALPMVIVLASTEWASVRSSVLDASPGATSIGWTVSIGALVMLLLGVTGAAAARGVLGRRAQRRLWRHWRRIRQGVLSAWHDACQVWVEIPRRGMRWMGAGLALAACQLTARLSVAWVVVRSLGSDLSAATSWALQWLTLTLAGAVPTPGGTGGAEAAFALLYAAWIPLETLPLATALWRACLYYVPLLLASLLLLAPWGKRPHPLTPSS